MSQGSSPRTGWAPLVLIVALFFLWGVANNLNDVLIPHLKKAFFLTDLQSTNGTWVNRGRLRPGGRSRIVPGDDICLGPKDGDGVRLRVKLRKRGTSQEGQAGAAAAAEQPVGR